MHITRCNVHWVTVCGNLNFFERVPEKILDLWLYSAAVLVNELLTWASAQYLLLKVSQLFKQPYSHHRGTNAGTNDIKARQGELALRESHYDRDCRGIQRMIPTVRLLNYCPQIDSKEHNTSAVPFLYHATHVRFYFAWRIFGVKKISRLYANPARKLSS